MTKGEKKGGGSGKSKYTKKKRTKVYEDNLKKAFLFEKKDKESVCVILPLLLTLNN